MLKKLASLEQLFQHEILRALLCKTHVDIGLTFHTEFYRGLSGRNSSISLLFLPGLDADADRGAAKYATDIEQGYHQASIFIALTAIVYTVEVIN